MYDVDFVGIIYFNLCEATACALAPDGTAGDDGMEPHSPSIFIDAENVDSDDWWSDHRTEHCATVEGDQGPIDLRFFEFRMPRRLELKFDCNGGNVETTNVHQSLGRLGTLDDQFVLDESGAIAKIPIPGGKLSAYSFGEARVVRWTIERHADPVTIIATDGPDIRRITLRGTGIQVVFSNTPDLLKKTLGNPHDHGSGHSHGSDDCGHFELFGKINKGPNGAGKFKCPNLKLPCAPPLTFSNPYLRVLKATLRLPNGNCSPTCC